MRHFLFLLLVICEPICTVKRKSIKINYVVESGWSKEARKHKTTAKKRIDMLFDSASKYFQKTIGLEIKKGKAFFLTESTPWPKKCTSIYDRIGKFRNWYEKQKMAKGYWHLFIGCDKSMAPGGHHDTSKCEGVSGSVWTTEVNSINLFAQEISRMLGNYEEPPFKTKLTYKEKGLKLKIKFNEIQANSMCERIKQCTNVSYALFIIYLKSNDIMTMS